MSSRIYLRQVYKQIPVEKRLCTFDFCGKPIRRNAALIDGRLCHFGCLKRSDVEPTHLCHNCGSFLTPSKITTIYINGERIRACGLCSSQDITGLSRVNWQPRPKVIFAYDRPIHAWPERSW